LEAFSSIPLVSPPLVSQANCNVSTERKASASLLLTIAAVAIHNQLILVTDNVKHYPMKELSLYPLPV
jgi:hypothetical protein